MSMFCPLFTLRHLFYYSLELSPSPGPLIAIVEPSTESGVEILGDQTQKGGVEYWVRCSRSVWGVKFTGNGVLGAKNH